MITIENFPELCGMDTDAIVGIDVGAFETGPPWMVSLELSWGRGIVLILPDEAQARAVEARIKGII